MAHVPYRDLVLKRLAPRHKNAAAMVAAGMTPKEISGSLNVAVRTVEYWMRSPMFQEEVSNEVGLITLATRHQAIQVRRKALSVIDDCLKSTNEKLRLSAAKAVINPLESSRAAGEAVDRASNVSIEVHFTTPPGDDARVVLEHDG